MIAHLGLVAVGVVVAATATAPSGDPAAKAGQTYAITLDRRMQESASDGSTASSSTDVDTIVERIIAVRADGVEAEFDLPDSATPQDRASVWQLPARALILFTGAPRLMNEEVLAARVDPWLRKGNLTRAQCGKGVFTWNYFTIECDPQSAIRMIERFHPAIGDVREGAAYHAPGAQGSTPLKAVRSTDGSSVLTAVLPIDSDIVRRGRAGVAKTVAEITGKTLAIETALKEQSTDRIDGTIEATFVLDRAGALKRRTIVTRTVTTKPDGVSMTQTVTEVLSRECLAVCS